MTAHRSKQMEDTYSNGTAARAERACLACPANSSTPAGSSVCLCDDGYIFISCGCAACEPEKFKPPAHVLVLQISTSQPGSFYYDSALWSNDETLNAQHTTVVSDVDVKLPAYSTVALSGVRLCVGTIDNCYEMSVEAASAKDLFSGSYQRREDLDQVHWQALFDANFPERYLHENCMQRPGFNTQCNDNNRARWGFCTNLPAQACQPNDSDDADAAIGLGINGQNTPTQLGVGYNDYFINGIAGESWKSFQAWVFVKPQPLPVELCSDCPAGTYSDAPGSAGCSTCPVDTYSANGASVCLVCPVGLSTPAGSSGCAVSYSVAHTPPEYSGSWLFTNVQLDNSAAWYGPDRQGSQYADGGDPRFFFVLDLGRTWTVTQLSIRNSAGAYSVGDFTIAMSADDPTANDGEVATGTLENDASSIQRVAVGLSGRYLKFTCNTYGIYSVGLKYVAVLVADDGSGS